MTIQRAYKHPQFNLRIPQEIKEKIETSANKNGRSTNAEIVQRLEESLKPSVGSKVGKEISRIKEIAFLAFKHTSPDFEEELNARMREYMKYVIIQQVDHDPDLLKEELELTENHTSAPSKDDQWSPANVFGEAAFAALAKPDSELEEILEQKKESNREKKPTEGYGDFA